MRLRLPHLLLAGAALLLGPGAAAQDKPRDGQNPFGGNPGEPDAPPKPLTPEDRKAADKLFKEGKALLKAGQYDAGRAKFKEFKSRFSAYEDEMEDMLLEVEDRSGDNCLVDIVEQHHAGPPERRLDVELMGDGYTEKGFKDFASHALTQLVPFWKDPLYNEYENYINVWRFDLISKDDGVDEVSAADRGVVPPPPDPKKPPKPPKKKKLKELQQFSTALDCKAMGPQNQVMANPEQVMRWRRYLECSDGLTIAFAKKGALGMGGGGIATTGRNIAVTHEFGHAFIGLLDEYTNNPNRPDGRVWAPNAISTDDPDPKKPPPMEEIPWKHWLVLKNSPVEVILGGATYQLGVFRPAKTCAMNSAGSAFYCPVCREAGVLRIYSYVSPIDESGPVMSRVQVSPSETKEFWVQPMTPKTHALQVEFYLQRLSSDPLPPATPSGDDGTSFVRDDRAAQGWKGDGDRAAARRENPLPEGLPPGSAWKSTVKKMPGGAQRHSVVLPKLNPGGWRLTARVFDDTKIGKDPHPWVIKDVARLREEWRTWDIDVPVPIPAPATAPPQGGTPAPAPNPPRSGN